MSKTLSSQCRRPGVRSSQETRFHMLQLKTLLVATKTQCSQIKKKKKKKKTSLRLGAFNLLGLFLFLFLNVVHVILGTLATESSGKVIKNANSWAHPKHAELK